MKLDKSQVLASAAYSVGQITLGFLLHPYQTMQTVVMDKVYAWMFLFPIGLLLAIISLWKNVIVPVVRIYFSCSEVSFFMCDWLPYLSKVVILYCWLWQGLLLYLFLRFYFLYKDE